MFGVVYVSWFASKAKIENLDLIPFQVSTQNKHDPLIVRS